MGKGRPARGPRTHQAAAWELDADAVTEDLARSVHAVLEPTHISIWLSE